MRVRRGGRPSVWFAPHTDQSVPDLTNTDPHPNDRSRSPAGDSARRVVTIGTFDGVHRGHRALATQCREIAGRIGPDALVAALVFDPNPAEVLRPDRVPARLTTFEQKSRLLRAAGADEVHRIEPTRDVLAQPAEAFVREIAEKYSVAAVVEGPDFRFGRGRGGDVALLQTLGDSLGFVVKIVEPVTVTLNDHSEVPARSTMVRWLLSHGRVGDAALVLGAPYTMTGTVERGDQRGRTIGFPTANLASPCMAPADGVYAGRARLEDGRVFPAAISVGTKPTFGPCDRAVEAVLLNDSPQASGAPRWAAPLSGVPEYGWRIELEFHRWLRDQVRFDSLESLLDQMNRDCAASIEYSGGPIAVRTAAPRVLA